MALERVLTAVEKLMSHIIKRILLMETARALRKLFLFLFLIIIESEREDAVKEVVEMAGDGVQNFPHKSISHFFAKVFCTRRDNFFPLIKKFYAAE